MNDLDIAAERLREKIEKIEKKNPTPKIIKKGRTLYIVKGERIWTR